MRLTEQYGALWGLLDAAAPGLVGFAGSRLLLPGAAPTAVLKALLPVLRGQAGTVAGHPGELLWRDLAVLERQVGSGLAAARRALATAVAISTKLPDSPVNGWNRRLIEVHRAALGDGPEPAWPLPAPAQRLAEQAHGLAGQMDRVTAWRQVSPW